MVYNAIEKLRTAADKKASGKTENDMGYYKILLADDEEEIRDGIISKLDWANMGFLVVGSAENGLEALEKAERLQPDVVITDIRMPFMDGLEFGEKLRAFLPSTKLIFFSGYDDFEYAQKAIQLNAVEYILKPINSSELTETLKKLKEQMDLEFAEKRDVETLRRNYRESLPVLREQFLAGLMEGREPKERMRAEADRYGINASAGQRAVALVRAEALPGAVTALGGQEELAPVSLKYTGGEVLSHYCRFHDFYCSGCVAVLAELDPETGISPLLAGIGEVCRAAEQVLDMRVTAGVGMPCDALADVRRSYRGANSALDYSVMPGYEKTVFIGDVESAASATAQFDDQDERELVNAVKMGSEEEIRAQVNGFFAKLEGCRTSLNQLRLLLMEQAAALLKVMRTYGIGAEDVFGADCNYAGAIFAFRTPEEMKCWYLVSCLKVASLIRRKRVDTTKLLAEKARQYIARNFSDPALSVEQISSTLHVSATYFSTMFKRDTGKSFVTYLTEVRLQEAVRLLDTTDDKTYIIAGEVGYTEPNYFSYVFKRKFGISPSKYRNHA